MSDETPKKRRTKKPSIDTLLAAIKNSRGIVSTVARSLDVDWHTAERWIEASPTTKRAFEDETELLLDRAELNIAIEIQRGDLETSKWVLSRKGKKRGYSPKNEIELTDEREAEAKILKLLAELGVSGETDLSPEASGD